MKADGLGSATSNQSSVSNFPPPFWQPWRAPSTASLAQGSGCSWAGVSPWGAQGSRLLGAPGSRVPALPVPFLGAGKILPQDGFQGLLGFKVPPRLGDRPPRWGPSPLASGEGLGPDKASRALGRASGGCGLRCAQGAAHARRVRRGCPQEGFNFQKFPRWSDWPQERDPGLSDHWHLDMGTAHSQDIQMPTSGPGSTCAQPQGSSGVSRRSGSLAGVGCLQVLASSPCSSCCCYQAWALERGPGVSLYPSVCLS